MKRQTEAKRYRVVGAASDIGSGLRPSMDGAVVLYHDYAALLAWGLEVEKRLPLCPPCDIGENTPCICDAELVPKAWMDDVVADLAASKALLAQWNGSAEANQFKTPTPPASAESPTASKGERQ